MRLACVVIDPPFFDDPARGGQVFVETLVTQAALKLPTNLIVRQRPPFVRCSLPAKCRISASKFKSRTRDTRFLQLIERNIPRRIA